MPEERFFISSDNDGHCYIVPLPKATEWQEWVDLDDDDERKWTAPEYAMGVDDPSTVTFTNPKFTV